MEVELVVVEGRPRGEVVPIRVSPFVIGRDPECQLRPRSPAVSGRHSAIRVRGGEVLVEDLGSTNGTLINDQFLRGGEAHRLVDGDRMQIGQLIFVVRINARKSRIESSVQDWLTDVEAGAQSDPGSRTLLLSALSQSSRPSNLESGVRLAPTEGTPAQFLYKELDPVYQVLCIGLSQSQITDEEHKSVRRALFTLAANPGYRRTVLDLSDIGSPPMAFYTLLLAVAQRWKQVGGELRLCSLESEVQRVVHALKLDRLAECYRDRYEAVAQSWA